ncbi:MAG: ribosome small subunit-dependent GTPase A [Treponema sp.]|nr:ribosome small subunit-dependent GTPase A [Treponema sp.]
MTGLVLSGSKNIFTIRPDSPGPRSPATSPHIECRIKGKILKGMEGFYNALAPGDRVKIEIDTAQPGMGMIVALEERINLFSRFNQKGSCTQLLAANIDQVLCLTTRVSPPFRPRFLDRVLVQADSADIPVIIVCNKIDLHCSDIDTDERLEDFRNIGYEVIEVSAKNGEGLEELRQRINGKRSVLVGQSGVGKSSVVNALWPELNIKTGVINEKYDRGNHTTTLAFMIETDNTQIIDTPGIRRFVPDGIDADDLILHMVEFAPLAGKCTFGLSCSHRREPGCKIMEAVHAGVIHEDRYNSFLRIQDELQLINEHTGKYDAD